jgi:hypothetical protein
MWFIGCVILSNLCVYAVKNDLAFSSLLAFCAKPPVDGDMFSSLGKHLLGFTLSCSKIISHINIGIAGALGFLADEGAPQRDIMSELPPRGFGQKGITE